jgi:hypothetical protein
VPGPTPQLGGFLLMHLVDRASHLGAALFAPSTGDSSQADTRAGASGSTKTSLDTVAYDSPERQGDAKERDGGCEACCPDAVLVELQGTAAGQAQPPAKGAAKAGDSEAAQKPCPRAARSDVLLAHLFELGCIFHRWGCRSLH